MPKTPAEIAAAFTLCREEVSQEHAEQIASALRVYGLEDAISWAAHDAGKSPIGTATATACADYLKAILAYRSCVENLADPALHASRLESAADILDAEVARRMKDGADWHGMAAGCRMRGDTAQADDYKAKGDRCEARAEKLQAEAAAKREWAAELRAVVSTARALTEIASPSLFLVRGAA